MKINNNNYSQSVYMHMSMHACAYIHYSFRYEAQFVYTVESPITDPPRSGQPPYNGHTPCYGMKLL